MGGFATAHSRADVKYSGCSFQDIMNCFGIAEITQDNLDSRVMKNFGRRKLPHEHSNKFLFLDEARHKRTAK